MDKRTSETIRDDAVRRFMQLAPVKYDMGQEEHGGLLDETVKWKSVEDEIIDLWFYIQSMKRRAFFLADEDTTARAEKAEARVKELGMLANGAMVEKREKMYALEKALEEIRELELTVSQKREVQRVLTHSLDEAEDRVRELEAGMRELEVRVAQWKEKAKR